MSEESGKPARRRLAAILACDICGYGQVMSRSEAAAVKLVEQLALLAESAVKRFEGRLLKRLGDGVILEFPSAVTAVECAALMQKRLAAFNTQSPEDQRFLVRIGIHLGEVIEAGGETLGDGINIACRLQTLARAGGIVLSEDVQRQIQNHTHLPTDPLGTKSLKHVDRPVRVFELLDQADPNPLRRFLRRWSRPRRLVIAGIVLLVLLGIGKESGRKAAMRQMLATLEQARTLYEQGQAEESFALLEKTARDSEPDAPGWSELQDALKQVRLYRVLEQAKIWYDAGRGKDALKLLEEVLVDLPADHPLRPEIETAIRKASDNLDKTALAERFGTFVQAWFDRDADRIGGFFDPTARGRGEFLTNLMKRRLERSLSQRPGPRVDESRVLDIQLGDDLKTARVEGEVLVSGAWQRLPAMVWKKVDQVWYLSVQPGWLSGLD